RTLDADVIAARRAAANANTASIRARAPVVRRTTSDSVLEVWRVQHMRRVDRRKTLFREPPVQYVHNPRAQRLGLAHTAVEQHLRRTDESAWANADSRRRRAPWRLTREKAREMSRDRRIGRVRQPQFLETGLAAARRHVVRADDREEAIDQHLLEIGSPKLATNRAADEPRSLPEHRHGVRLAIRVREERFFRRSTLMPERLQLPSVDSVALGFEALLNKPRQGKVHVVAAEEDVIAD